MAFENPLGSANIIVRGDVISRNWDGTIPVDLSGGADAGATAGFALDSDSGSAQFEGSVFIEGSLEVGGTFTVTGSGSIGGSVQVGGDILAAAWDGADPVDLSGGADGTATAGYAFDSSEGTGQLEGSLYVGGDILLEGGRVYTEGGSSEYVEVTTGQINLGSGHPSETSPAIVRSQVVLTNYGQTIFYAPDLGLGLSSPHLWLRNHTATATERLAAIVASDFDSISIAPGEASISPLGTPAVGVSRVTMNAPVYLPTTGGSAAAPALTFNGNTDLGLFRVSADVLGFATNGIERIRIKSGGNVEFSQGTGLAEIQDTATVAAPSYSFQGDLDTGIYRSAADQISFSIGGTEDFRFLADQLQVRNGTVGAPVYSFINDTDTGMQLQSTGNLSWSVGGSEMMRLNSTALELYRGGINLVLGNADTIEFQDTGAANTFSLRLNSSNNFQLLDLSGNIRFVFYDDPAGTTGSSGDYRFYNDQNTYVYWYDEGSGSHRFYDENGQELVRLDSAYGSGLAILEDFVSIGNHEVLRANRTASGTAVTEVGYYSSWSSSKESITPLARSPKWKREWLLDLRPVTYLRKGRRNHREIGFTIENLIEHTPLLTTKGSKVGDSPDEFALSAVLVDYVQHLEERVRALESAMIGAERSTAKVAA